MAIDWARGLAVIVMILAHVTDAWTRPSERTTVLFRDLTVLGGFAAPLFLWLAGLSSVLAGEAMLRQGLARSTAWRRLVQRGLEVFILAFLFRAHSFVFNPGGAALSIFRVDILNIMGPAMVATGLLWGAVRSRVGQLTVFALVTVSLAMVTPVVRVAGWVDELPVWLQWYVRPAGEYTVFTLFPWAGFVFGGAASGALFGAVRDARSERRLQLGLLAAGVGLVGLGFYTASLPSLYRQSSFWTSSPTFFAIRAGLLILFLALLYALSVALRTTSVELATLRRLGRSSLLVYWIHVQLVYGWATLPLHHRLTVGRMLLACGLFTVAMYGLIPLRDRLMAAWAERRLDRDQPRVASV